MQQPEELPTGSIRQLLDKNDRATGLIFEEDSGHSESWSFHNPGVKTTTSNQMMYMGSEGSTSQTLRTSVADTSNSYKFVNPVANRQEFSSVSTSAPYTYSYKTDPDAYQYGQSYQYQIKGLDYESLQFAPGNYKQYQTIVPGSQLIGSYQTIGESQGATVTVRESEVKHLETTQVKTPTQIIHETQFVPMIEMVEVEVPVEVYREIPVYVEPVMTRTVEIEEKKELKLGDTVERRVVLPQLRKAELPQAKTIVQKEVVVEKVIEEKIIKEEPPPVPVIVKTVHD